MAKDHPQLIPLGGVAEVGKNANVIRFGGELLLIDAGVSFPGEEMHGVDLVIPDYTYLLENADRLRGIILTHGHEDHIGSLPFFLRQLNRPVPVYATPLTQGLASNRLREQRVLELADFRTIDPGLWYPIGPFEVRPFRVSHSVPDGVGLAIRTAAGTLVYTSDFKLDETPVGGPPTDIGTLKELGEQGVLALLSDCVRVEQPGRTPSEMLVVQTLQRLFGTIKGRIIVTTFASNITRLQEVIRISHEFGRRVAVVGRSLEENLAVASQLGYLEVPEGTLVSLEEANRLNPQQVTLLATGSQGEPTSVLSRIAMGDHPRVRIIPGDTVVVAATPVPGNEETVSNTIDNLYRRGATVIYKELEPGVHVSGHASRDELRQVIEWTRPQFAVPIHGEYRHLILYRALAVEAGVPFDNVVLPDIGDVIQFGPDQARRVGHVVAGSVLVDGISIGGVTQTVLRERGRLAEEGLLIAAVAVDRETGELLGGPEVIARGFVHPDSEDLLQGARKRIERALRRRPRGEVEYGYLVGKIREVLGRYVYEETHRRPLVLPVVTEV